MNMASESESYLSMMALRHPRSVMLDFLMVKLQVRLIVSSSVSQTDHISPQNQ